MKFGLKQSDLDYILSAIKKFPQIESACIFGSRAIGNYKISSDIDLCIKGEDINIDTLSNLRTDLEDSGPIPYQFDIINYKDITVSEFKEHIDNFGIALF